MVLLNEKEMTMGKRTKGKVEFIEKTLSTETNECVNWPFKLDKDGYGCNYGKGERKAHRALFAMACGAIPAGLVVMHKCDNPSCVNPSHLILGTQAENMRDMRAKGRAYLPKMLNVDNRGEGHPKAKLNNDLVQFIRSERLVNKSTASSLAKVLGVSRQAVADVMRGATWTHV